MGFESSSFRQRIDTLRVMVMLVCARILVRYVPWAYWKKSLGQNEPDRAHAGDYRAELPRAEYWVGRIHRASGRLPGVTKCLPQAIVLQWIMAGVGLPSDLIIAVHRHDREGTHALHAWVETRGTMLIGNCDRSQFEAVATFKIS